MARSEDGEDEDEDEDEPGERALRWEFFPNPRPFLSVDDLPGFRLYENQVNRGYYRKGPPKDSIYEVWSQSGPPGQREGNYVNITMYLTSDRKAALKAARVLFYAVTKKNQPLNAIGKPNPGSYSGQPIGDYCWHNFPRRPGDVRPRFNRTSSLVVIEKSYLFKIMVTGPEPGFEDAYVESLAKTVVARLKTWKRP